MTLAFDANTTNNNGDDGLELVSIGDPNVPLFSADIDITGHTSDGNSDDGIAVAMGNGDLLITGSLVNVNVGDGISVNNFTNNVAGTSTTISGNTITGNGAGAAAGINYFLDIPSAPPADQVEMLVVSGNTINNNGVNVMVVTSGAGTMLDTDVIDNPSISGFATDGVSLQALRGSAQTIDVSNNTITGIAIVDPNDPNGTVRSTGAGIRLIVDDLATDDPTTMTGTITNNTITNVGGQGTDGIAPDFVAASGAAIAVNGESFFDVTFENNTFNAGDGSALLAQFDVTDPTVVNGLDLIDNTFNGSGADDTIIITSNSVTLLDLIVTGNQILDAAQEAFQLDLFDDTLTRLVFADNQLIDSSADSDSERGVQVFTSNNAELLMTFTGNIIQGHGGSSMLVDDPPNPNWSEGFRISAVDASRVSLRAVNNEISESALEGMRLDVDGTATMYALVLDNSFRNNDLAFSDPNEPTGEQDFIAETLGAGSELCLALHNNFANTGLGYLIDKRWWWNARF